MFGVNTGLYNRMPTGKSIQIRMCACVEGEIRVGGGGGELMVWGY